MDVVILVKIIVTILVDKGKFNFLVKLSFLVGTLRKFVPILVLHALLEVEQLSDLKLQNLTTLGYI